MFHNDRSPLTWLTGCRYTSAVSLLRDLASAPCDEGDRPSTDINAEASKSLLLPCLSNAAMACLKLIDLGGAVESLGEKAIKFCEEGLAIDATNEKMM